MRKKHFFQVLFIFLVSAFSCFSAQDLDDASPFSLNLSKINWKNKPSVDLAISFLKFPETHLEHQGLRIIKI